MTIEDWERDINVFDARNLADKLGRIRSIANADEMSPNSCNALLSELHTACEAESCSDPNERSHQLSVDQVCRAVNTRTKLDLDVLGRFFEFRNWAVAGGNCLRSKYSAPFLPVSSAGQG